MQPNKLPGTFSGHFISAPWRSSGKTMLASGLARTATRRSLSVQMFKKGPDYIDPLWLKAASGNPCFNLDPWLQTPDEVRRVYVDHIVNNDVVMVEGTMGLHDGLAEDGSDSNAGVAKQLGLPVLLVVDCRGMHRTIAALINGIQQFDPSVDFTGVILNRIRSERHSGKIIRAVAEYSDIDVLGVIPEVSAIQVDERELGLLPAPAHPTTASHINKVADLLEQSCDLDTVFSSNLETPDDTSAVPVGDTPATVRSRQLRIGIARDEAFHFYYEDDLRYLQSRGVELVELSPLRDELPADLDGMLIGGGFPERHAQELSENVVFRQGLAKMIAKGLPVRAECAGLMFLCRSIAVDDVVWPMVGAIEGAVTMQKSPRGRGYMKLEHLRPEAGGSGTGSNGEQLMTLVSAHEFHHSSIDFDTVPEFAYRVRRGYGVDGQYDGVCVNNVIASYAHFRHSLATPWVDWFLLMIEPDDTFTAMHRKAAPRAPAQDAEAP